MQQAASTTNTQLGMPLYEFRPYTGIPNCLHFFFRGNLPPSSIDRLYGGVALALCRCLSLEAYFFIKQFRHPADQLRFPFADHDDWMDFVFMGYFTELLPKTHKLLKEEALMASVLNTRKQLVNSKN